MSIWVCGWARFSVSLPDFGEIRMAITTHHRKWCLIMLKGAVPLLFPISAWALPTDYSVNLLDSEFGHLLQGEVCGFEADGCGPTAAINSFVFLQNRYSQFYGKKLIPGGDMVAAGIDLAENYMNTSGATYIDNFITGKRNYIEEKTGPGGIFLAQVFGGALSDGGTTAKDTVVKKPDSLFLAEELQKGEDVEFLSTPLGADGKFDPKKGHYLTLVKLNWVDANNDGIMNFDENATIGFIDPAGSTDPGSISSFKDNRHISVGPDGFMDLENPFTHKKFRITAIVSESPPEGTISEPSSLLLILTALGSMALIVGYNKPHMRARRG
jgi:hypothetical protein